MPELFEEHGFPDWYDKDIHIKAIRYFEKFYPSSMIYLSQEDLPHKKRRAKRALLFLY